MLTVWTQTRQTPAQCRGLCSRVRCASGPGRQVCQSIRGATFLAYNPDKCQCCQQCVKFRYEGQSCGVENSIAPVRCAEGLVCDRSRISCVATRRPGKRSLTQLVSGATKTKAECKRMCMAVRCAPADPTKCAAISNSVYLDYAPELCRCCSVCQVNLSVGQNCAPELRLSKKCNPGLTCDINTKLCVKQ
ncbi:unnamed protein product [Medioppia subpectinata]|uniref:Uncharacterized protein n=1 Tax=Medioppia subpectinata TaxID=1979941 RepID=A0A7R9PZU6_9ACAR|nr:unnamed protein product [Medioppia subpectinata]CAG2107385.1 unnamed protein product [Medioppia subpectinata]